ncbi:hypothetical protein PIB30_054616 [Stylosanthes scabra]|uniref:Uncharacterized protein n=1 Tax=Stylosanthes scabra TaxID=79078 RepID=A0ABU6SIQ0_9FABA|nr:hypothetical protein [Stylosanthes scabra]
MEDWRLIKLVGSKDYERLCLDARWRDGYLRVCIEHGVQMEMAESNDECGSQNLHAMADLEENITESMRGPSGERELGEDEVGDCMCVEHVLNMEFKKGIGRERERERG